MTRLLLPLLLALGGCPIGNDRQPKPRDLEPSWQINRLRVLAIRADPPEVAPGQQARFEALVVDPDGEIGAVVWLACPPESSGGIGFGCALDPDLDFTNASFEELEDAGVIGFEPTLPPRYAPPITALEDVDEDEARNGIYALIQIVVIPQDVLDDGFGAGGDLDFNRLRVAYKRLRVSTKDVRNANPEILRWRIDDIPVPDEAVVEVDPDERYDVGVFLTEGSVEVYEHINRDGQREERQEQPFVTWYTDGGTMEETVTLWPFLDATWRAPSADAEVTEGTWWAVIRDRRGGMSWSTKRWRLRDPSEG